MVSREVLKALTRWMHLKTFFKQPTTARVSAHRQSVSHGNKATLFFIEFQFSRLLHREQPCHPVTTVSPATTTTAEELLICVSQPALFDKRDTNYLRDNGKVSPISWSVFSNCPTVILKCIRNPLCFCYFVFLCFCPRKLCHGRCEECLSEYFAF